MTARLGPSMHYFPQLIESDPYLGPHTAKILQRISQTSLREARLTRPGQSITDFASAHEYFGLHKTKDAWFFRELAPAADAISMIGDFSNWEERPEFFLHRIDNHGAWEIKLPLDAIKHGQLFKLKMHWKEPCGQRCEERIPAYIRRVIQDPKTNIFSAQVWEPPEPYQWKNPDFRISFTTPRIYESHVGMAQEEGRVGTYKEFAKNVLPRIAEAGYNTVQIMAIQEHPYYGSFGYQVSSFYAASSRFGTPEELKELVDTAHGMGLAVIMDLVHSHAVKNEVEGLSKLDGSYTLYFHEGARGEHSAWNTRCFNYGKTETLHFLLSNCRFWLDAFKFDGFRFDGVTSLVYKDHGLGSGFCSYDAYFNDNVDVDALVYLTLANKVIHTVRPDAITIAEDVSGMPGLASPQDHGGMGFNYRLAMGIPDYWIKIIKHESDENWNVGSIWRELVNHRADEKTISYAESHDQALVGDKTIFFRLADQEMYWHMQKADQNLIVERAVALHKMIRLITLSTAGHGYLNFMGNEFGHPEWIDFPREGNGWSYHYARRQWSLRDNPDLRYHQLGDFDKAMMDLAEKYQVIDEKWPNMRYEHVEQILLAFERAGLIFAFNFHPSVSYPDLKIKAFCETGSFKVVLNSDDKQYGGYGRIDNSISYPVKDGHIHLYLPNRTALVLARAE